jgi:hypothetical protein
MSNLNVKVVEQNPGENDKSLQAKSQANRPPRGARLRASSPIHRAAGRQAEGLPRARAQISGNAARSLALLHLYLHLHMGQYRFATGLLPFSAIGARQDGRLLV